MNDRQLYATILGLQEPWVVSEVEVAGEASEVRVRLALREGTELHCPECKKAVPGYDESSERRWRHLDTCQYRTVLVARIPRVACPVLAAAVNVPLLAVENVPLSDPQ